MSFISFLHNEINFKKEIKTVEKLRLIKKVKYFTLILHKFNVLFCFILFLILNYMLSLNIIILCTINLINVGIHNIVIKGFVYFYFKTFKILKRSGINTTKFYLMLIYNYIYFSYVMNNVMHFLLYL